MSDFTVEVTTAPPSGGNWSQLRHVLDVVPGTVLIEDPERPVLIFPVEADEPLRAAMFVEGITKLCGIEVVSGQIQPAPPVDFDRADDDETQVADTKAIAQVRDWLDDIPSLPRHDQENGNLSFA